MIHLKSFNPKGDPTYKITWIDRAIMLRSDLTHTEIQFSERYGGISFSATMADGCKCARFKMIGYSHPLRWLTVDIACTDEQEDMIFTECCRMADKIYTGTDHRWLTDAIYYKGILDRYTYHGPNALKYDLLGLLSFCTRWSIIRPHAKWVWCDESCLRALLVVYANLLVVPDGYGGHVTYKPDDLQPEDCHRICKSYFNLRKVLTNE